MLLANLYQRLTSLPRTSKKLVVIAFDTLISWGTTWLAFCLRLGTPSIDWTWEQLCIFVLTPALAIPIFARLGLYRAIFRYSGFGAAVTVVRAVSIYAVVFVIVVLALSLPNVPRTVAVIQPVLFAWSVLALRSMGQLALRDVADAAERQILLIFGAGVTGIRTAASLLSSSEFRIVGFVDDDATKVGREIMGRRVHSRAQAEALIEAKQVNNVLIALPGVSRTTRNDILDWLRPFPVHVQSVPSTAEIATGRVTLNDLRELDIEDVLGRDPVPEFDAGVRHDVLGRVVAVTGAGGSIGSELCRQLLRAMPARLLLLESSEFALYSIHDELRSLGESLSSETELIPLLCNVQNQTRIDEIMQTWQPAIAYHAAAYKHVPLVEHNPAEGVANNVLGTLVVARAAVRSGVAKLVLISTDKAVRPTNVMGASKRLAEIVLQAMAAETALSLLPGQSAVPNRTVLTMVRFGNVLGSSGSVVPLFRAQLAAGGPLTVTHKDVIRYFMTIPEAVQLVLQAGAMAKGGEVFLLDMGEPVRIYDLARRIVELSGSTVRDDANPDGDVEIQITGLRPGEKLYEELLIDGDTVATAHPRIRCARERMFPWTAVSADLATLREALTRNDTAAMREILIHYVDGFTLSHSVDWIELAADAVAPPVEPKPAIATAPS